MPFGWPTRGGSIRVHRNPVAFTQIFVYVWRNTLNTYTYLIVGTHKLQIRLCNQPANKKSTFNSILEKHYKIKQNYFLPIGYLWCMCACDIGRGFILIHSFYQLWKNFMRTYFKSSFPANWYHVSSLNGSIAFCHSAPIDTNISITKRPAI